MLSSFLSPGGPGGARGPGGRPIELLMAQNHLVAFIHSSLPLNNFGPNCLNSVPHLSIITQFAHRNVRRSFVQKVPPWNQKSFRNGTGGALLTVEPL